MFGIVGSQTRLFLNVLWKGLFVVFTVAVKVTLLNFVRNLRKNYFGEIVFQADVFPQKLRPVSLMFLLIVKIVSRLQGRNGWRSLKYLKRTFFSDFSKWSRWLINAPPAPNWNKWDSKYFFHKNIDFSLRLPEFELTIHFDYFHRPTKGILIIVLYWKEYHRWICPLSGLL